MKYTAEVNINSKDIIKNHKLNENGEVNKFLRNEVDRLSDPYVPMDTGMLKVNKRYPDNSSIVYASPYAHYMYYGKLMVAPNGSSWAKKGEKKHYTGKSLKYQGAPKRGAKWVERMMNDRKQDIIKNIQNYINGGK